jgi:hypothetical protein
MIASLVGGVTQQQAQVRPSPDEWSILEVIAHLYDEEREDFRTRLEIMLFRPQEPLPPIDPQGWVRQRGYNQKDLHQTLNDFLIEREKSLVWLRSLDQPDWEAVYTNAYGSMKAGDMLAAWTAHDQLHMRQLVELRRKRLEGLCLPYDLSYAGDW